MTRRKDPSTDTPAKASKALTWWKYDVMQQQSDCRKMTLAARGLDAFMSDDAWANPDGSCRVKSAKLASTCADEQLDPAAMWGQLKKSGRWTMTADKQWLIATHLLARREEGAGFIEHKREAGRRSGATRRAQAEERRQKEASKAAALTTETTRTGVRFCSDTDDDSAAHEGDVSPFQDNDFEHTRTPVRAEHKTVQSTTDLLSGDRVVLSSDAAAVHAEGATAPSAGVAVRRSVPFLPSLVCEETIASTVLPPAWMDPDTARVVAALQDAGAAVQVDVERALYRLYAAHGGPMAGDRHLGLRDELLALLEGEAGREGYLSSEHAPRAIACALHGALAHKHPVIGPVLFRGIASATARALAEQPDADGRALAAAVTLDFSAGKRLAGGYTLPCDGVQRPSRLLGHVTRQEVTAA